MAPLAISSWWLHTESFGVPSSLGLISPLLVTSCFTGIALLLGALYLLYRERGERRRVAGALAQKSVELQELTANAVSLAREVVAARTEMQRVNVLERTEDLRTSKTALRREIVEREQADVSLRESESNLLLARKEFAKGSATHTEELERSNRELEQFAYVASHDLQEPLRAISGCVQILARRYKNQLDSQGHELITHTVEGVARLKELIEGLLAYSRVSRLGADTEPVSLETALTEAVQQVAASIEETGAVVEHEELPMVCGHRGQIVQLLQNLIGNALKYRAVAAPLVRISARAKEGLWTIAIRDNGIGIDPQYFDRVFSIFQRLHTRDEYPGTGIGLAICKRIVEQAGGTIWIESSLGVGSTFYFTLPSV
jgi:light-regulated signal transduction histidine kinase (bacteriophytochrome)